ncbi:MAG TPA: phosphomannomutase, partial [Candidatus Brocadiaceae bacterium]|nr:phosphomannomutase [Candidatus Brocadiaceae bacterium]
AIVAYEESDGITGYRNTLEKDAMFGFLLAIEMVAVTGKNLGEYLRELEAEFGAYFPERASIQVDRSLTGDLLTEKLSILKAKLPVGGKVTIGKKTKIITNVITVDGMKFVLEDNSWFLIRPSGTEPKVRFYVEPRTSDEIDVMVKMCESLVKEALA